MPQKKTSSLKLNALLNSVLKMSEFIFPLITFPYVSRILLPTGTGKVTLATSIVAYFLMFAQLGIPTYGVRECAKVRDNRMELSKTVQELFLINIITSAIAYAAFFIMMFSIPWFGQEKPLRAIASLTILFNCIGMEWLYQGLEMYKYITLRSVIFKFIALIAMFVFIHAESDYVIYGAITIFAASASNILNFINLHNIVTLKPIKGLNLKKHLKAVFIFFAMSCATTVYMNLDAVMLGIMKTDADVGLYNAAVKIKTILVSIVTALGVVLLPRSTQYIKEGLTEEFHNLTRKAMNFVVVAAAPVSLYFALFAKECILVLSGENYEGSIVPMIVIVPTVFFIGMSNITGIQVLLPLGKEKIVLYSEIAGAVLDFIINIILIPQLASTGAAIGTLAAEILVWVFQFIILRKSFPGMYRNTKILIIAIALVVAGGLSYLVKLLGFGNFVTLVISAIVFFVVYIVILLIGKENVVTGFKNQLVSRLKHN